jgi:hypothetical protein
LPATAPVVIVRTAIVAPDVCCFARTSPRAISLPTRFGLGGLSLLLLAMLVTAACLPPDPRGFGTHERLGLPPCGFHQLVGGRCPSCGMTTSWAHLTRGEIGRALQANLAGALLAVLAAGSAPWLLACALRGTWIGGRPGDRIGIGLVATLVAVALIQWAFCLAMG